jgi:pimeloyl-ACP methyl ester carboxylesterase
MSEQAENLMSPDRADTRDALWQRLRAFRAAYPARELQIGDIRWRYRVGGRGAPALVILPGGTRAPDTYFLLAKALEARHHLLLLAYPAVPTMAGLVTGTVAVLQAEGFEQADCLGSSFGGFVAQCLVRRYPERVRRIILAHTSAPPLRPLQRYAGPLLRWLPSSLLRAATRRTIRGRITAPSEQRAFWFELVDEILRHWTSADLIAAFREISDFARHYRFAPTDLSGWSGRMLILESENDEFAGPRARAGLRALYPSAQVHTFRGAGHTAMLTRTDEYLAVVDRFLAAPD